MRTPRTSSSLKSTPIRAQNGLVADTECNVLSWTDEPFVNNYVSDDEQFYFPPNGDMWVMPDYYLTHGMKDDCDGWMVAVTSLMLSGEMSVKENGQFVRTVIPAKAVLGYMGGFRDSARAPGLAEERF